LVTYTAFNIFGNPVYGIHCRNVSVTFSGDIPTFNSVRTLQEFKPDIFLKDGDSLSGYGVNASIIALPGHTDGSIGIDCLFRPFP